jgi:hypothetical protein
VGDKNVENIKDTVIGICLFIVGGIAIKYLIDFIGLFMCNQ